MNFKEANFHLPEGIKPGLHWNANRTQTRHPKTMRMFDTDVLMRRGK